MRAQGPSEDEKFAAKIIEKLRRMNTSTGDFLEFITGNASIALTIQDGKPWLAKRSLSENRPRQLSPLSLAPEFALRISHKIRTRALKLKTLFQRLL